MIGTAMQTAQLYNPVHLVVMSAVLHSAYARQLLHVAIVYGSGNIGWHTSK